MDEPEKEIPPDAPPPKPEPEECDCPWDIDGSNCERLPGCRYLPRERKQP
jgi:hypothetical protein